MDEETRDIIRRRLVESLGEGKVLWRAADTVLYRKDTYRIDFEKEYEYIPDFVVLPETAKDVETIVAVASEHKVPLVPKGGGSNRTGMLVPVNGGIVVDTIKMDKVIEMNPQDLEVTVQPGITLKNLEEYLNEHGLTLTQEQGSQRMATVGGAISTSAFSRKNQKHGTIANRVMSLEVMVAGGRTLRTGPKVLYTSTGIGLHHLFVGAEGTLGIITEATLRVEPYPEAREMVLAFFDDFWKANEAAQRLMSSCVTFTGAEAYETEDATVFGAPAGKNGLFYVGFDGTRGEVEAEKVYVSQMIRELGGVIADETHTRAYMDRYTEQWCGARVATRFEDVITAYVPMGSIQEFYDRLWDDVMKRHDLKPIPGEKYSLDVGRYKMVGGRYFLPEDREGWQRYQAALKDVAKLAIELGGSISSCHGVGIQHKENIRLEYTDVALDLMRSIKRALDPDNIMNPGKKLPDE
ncbi:MAG: FAD-binding oxidoreductase [Candidatus Thermoplasmatota archaeon]|nr:FAD-binding oxidoreductase [Candidatus Thermoplasmatota archaeon]